MVVVNYIAGALIILGMVFFTGAAIGIMRFPDFYSRLHAAGKMDTLASLLTMLGLALITMEHLNIHSLLTAAKILMIMFFVFLASPTATHAMVDAGLRAGLKHVVGEEIRESDR